MEALDPASYELVGVVHLLRPTGRQAEDLDSLRRQLAEASPGELFQHTVQHRLRFPSAMEPPADDFSNWVGGVLQDPEMAERLAFAVIDRGRSAAETRAAVLDVLGSGPALRSHPAPEGGRFEFLEAESVRVPTGIVVGSVPELFEALADVDPSVWFYHLIERPWFGDTSLSFATWLRAHRDPRRAAWFEEVIALNPSLEGARETVLRKWRRSQVGARAIVASHRPEPERREAGRSAVASLVRRLKTEEDET